MAVLIAIFITTSGAHFNPAVTLADWWLSRRATPSTRFPGSHVVPYAVAQFTGGTAGAFLANAMFDVPPGIATTDRVTPGTLLAEVVATAGLVLVIFSLVRTGNARIIPITVAGYIGAAYWFTSSTSFANPAVTVGRVFSDTFAGIAPTSVLPYLGAQTVGAVIGIAVITFLYPRAAAASPDVQEAAENQLVNT